MKKHFLLLTHLAFAAAGFALGIYALPILTAPSAPTASEMATAKNDIEFSGQFRRDLKGSDFLHWGDGTLAVSRQFISLQGSIAPGPDYKLYLSPVFVEDEAEFLQHKSGMIKIGDVKTFKNFIVSVPAEVNPKDYTTAIIWCESFSEFISAAKYQ